MTQHTNANALPCVGFFIAKTWWLWCSGNTILCGSIVTGSIPVSHPTKNILPMKGVFCYTKPSFLHLRRIAMKSTEANISKVLIVLFTWLGMGFIAYSMKDGVVAIVCVALGYWITKLAILGSTDS